MKKIGSFGKIVFFFNSILAVLLVLGYVLPYIPPHILPVLSIISLFLPVLLILNGFFFVYWLLRGRRQLLLSGIALALGIFHILALYRFGGEGADLNSDLSIMSYNLKGLGSCAFQLDEDIREKLNSFIYRENPDVLCLQEFYLGCGLDSEVYPYNNRLLAQDYDNLTQIIYSKYPIVGSGSLEFDTIYNNGVYVDIVVKNDTVRVYNIHFESLRIAKNFRNLKKDRARSLFWRVGKTFKKQEVQLVKFLKNQSSSPYPVIVAGDFNNSATSYLYRKVKGDKNDAFVKAGSGTGATFMYDFVPLRIDFILADPEFEVVNFKTYDKPYSDHRPIKSSFILK